MSYRVLVVEDETAIRLGLEDCLRIAGYLVETAGDGEAALRRALRGGLDVIVLDLILPLMDGCSVCKQLRRMGIQTPVLIVTARSSPEDILRGFSIGADDYLTKPFESLELLARIRAVLKRSRSAAGTELEQGRSDAALHVDSEDGSVWRGRERVELSTKEQALLRYFMAHPYQILSREQILESVWKSRLGKSSRTVDVHVASLRRKIGDDPGRPRHIRTAFGEGYEFVPH